MIHLPVIHSIKRRTVGMGLQSVLPGRSGRAGSPGFTLVEMMVAMAITLLMMAALARSFGFIGNKVQESRAETDLAGKLRDMTTRLSDELKQCTVNLAPNDGEDDQLGYFVYYEGPVTNATSSLFRVFNDSSGNVVLGDSKYGDFDDYIAFTAVAQGNNWFTGKVPRYLLDQRTGQIAGTGYTLPTPASTAFEPVVIRSKYAEIIYFASPEYATASLPANPSYIDVDGDTDFGSGSASENGIPDRIRIHRRVLLIRPDLNLTSGRLPVQNSGTVDFMRADAWPTATTTTVTASANVNLGWLYGMAGVHQQCDLSIRRVLNASGLPTTRVAANSLADLSKPHNRFAHVRVPNNLLTGSGTATSPTSMPVLALGGPATILSATTQAATIRLAPPNVGTVITPNALCGFLRPEFVLGNDLTHLDSTTDSWGLERIGEDLLTNNALGFDVQVYDPAVSVFTIVSSGAVVGPSDAGYREAVSAAVVEANASPTPSPRTILWERGDYVDLAYPVLAGGPIRGWQARMLDRRSTTNAVVIGTAQGFLVTPFSGIARYGSVVNARTAYQPGLYKSGRLVTVGNTIRLFQPTFDTFTSFYERDGFYQQTVAGSGGVRWTTTTTSTGTTIVDRGSDGLDNDRAFGVDDAGERETLAPFRNRPEAIRVTIRIENTSTRQIRQASVTHRDEL